MGEPEDWRLRAACRHMNPELFFPEGTAGRALAATGRAKQICGTCPVRAQCLGWERKAAAHAEIFGLLAGAVDHPRLARTLNSAMEFVGELMGVAGPATGPLTANSHRRLLAFLLAGNPEGAARELESYLRVLRFMGRLAGGPEPSIAMR
jgi:WhiB family transcriptional regulator, redox-sensing transcriptional regulator